MGIAYGDKTEQATDPDRPVPTIGLLKNRPGARRNNKSRLIRKIAIAPSGRAL